MKEPGGLGLPDNFLYLIAEEVLMNIPLLLLKNLEFRRNARRSPQEFSELRLRKFRRFVRFVNSRSPYYARIIKEHNIDVSTCVPESFPVLTKQTLMEHFNNIVTTPDVTKEGIADFLSRSTDPFELFKGKFIALHTSGSSGEIGYFVYSRRDWSRGYAQFSRLHPFSFRKRTAAYYGATQGHFAGVTLFLTPERSLLKILYHTEIFEINGPLQGVVDRLNALQPDILSGYPSGLQVLARKQLAGELRIAPSFTDSGGEPLSPDARHIIEMAFPVPLLDLYASTEHLLMAMTHPLQGGMYLLEDDLIFELHPDHTCVTNLFNRTLPLIRYRMEDVLQAMPEADRLVPYTRVKELIGRMEQTLLFTNRHGREDFISPIVIVEFHVKNLRRFQIRRLSRSSFLFRACLEKGLETKEREDALHNIRMKLQELLSQKEMDNVTFDIEEVDDLQVDPQTGKFRLISI
jgi:phenylacetate-CoA ligase